MASSTSSSLITLPLQLLRYGTSPSRLGNPALQRPSPPSSVRLQQPATRGLKPVAAASYHVVHDEAAAGHRGDGIASTNTLLLRQVVDDAAAMTELRAARRAGRAPPPPKGQQQEGNGGSGGAIHAAPTLAAKRVSRAPAPPAGLPKEGHGGQGGSHH